MEEVTVSRTVDASRERVDELLSPRSIVEYAGTYEIWDVDRTDDGWVVSCGTAELSVVLEFTETDVGYVYRQRADEGPFGEMYSSVALAGTDPVEVTARSCFTFDMPLSWLTDKIAARERRAELRRVVTGIALVAEGEVDPARFDAADAGDREAVDD